MTAAGADLALRALQVLQPPKRSELWGLLQNVMASGDWSGDSAARLASHFLPSRPRFVADDLKWVSTACEPSNGPREVFRWVRSEGGTIMATNGKILFQAPTPFSDHSGWWNVNQKDAAPGWCAQNGLEWPNVKGVVPAKSETAPLVQLGDWDDALVRDDGPVLVRVGAAWFDVVLVHLAFAGCRPGTGALWTQWGPTTAARLDFVGGRVAVVMPHRLEP